MAINFLDNIQLNQNQILGVRIENVTSDPSSGNGGDIIFNSTSKKLKYYDGTTPFNASGWITLSASDPYGSWTLQGDSGTNQSITADTTVDWAGGTGISTATTNNTLTITNTKPFDSLTLGASAGNESTISNNGNINILAGTGITTTGNGSGNVTIAATGSGSMSSFTVSADSGSDITVSNAETLQIVAGGNTNTTAASNKRKHYLER